MRGLAAFHALLAIDIDPYAFACDGDWLGVPHGLNVLTNLPFLLVGAWGLVRLARRGRLADPAFLDWTGLWISVFLLAFGSGAYHLFLTPATLALDRLCITGIVACLGARIFAATTGRGPDPRVTGLLLIVCPATVLAWVLGGTSWLYGALQAVGGVLAVVLVLRAHRRGVIGREVLRPVLFFASAYALAKVVEGLDAPICALTGAFGGHPLKHLLSAAGLLALGAWMAHDLQRPADAMSQSSTRARSSPNSPARGP